MNTQSVDYIDDLYVQYIENPENVSEKWRRYFEQFSLAAQRESAAHQAAGNNGSPTSLAVDGHENDTMWLARMQERVDQLVREYRVRGHLLARVDPLNLRRAGPTQIDTLSYGLSDADLTRPFTAPTLNYTNGKTVGDILQKLQNTYCRSIGAQFTHIDDRNIRDWLQRRMESTENRLELSRDVQIRLYERLADAEIFEAFIRKKFVGSKTFSLEGAESLIPLLDRALEKAGEHGVQSVVMGMAHRGRLNVLANILGKRGKNIFWSFDDPQPELFKGGGDVKYHLGYSSDWVTSTGAKIHVSMCFNPSHLEYVNPVVLGRCRAKQDRVGDSDRKLAMPIIIHGDAAFAGEGVVQETLNLSELPGYRTGGALHIVINNQIGFTTEPDEGRSTTYCTDVFKMLQSPIFHVNGEDPEAVAQVVSLAMDFRHNFGRDVIIDLYAYRRFGHNEVDEPRYTQPRMYQLIEKQRSVRENYLGRLLQMGELTREEADEITRIRDEKLNRELEAAKTETYVSDVQSLNQHWSGYFGGPEPAERPSVPSIAQERLGELLGRLTKIPDNFGLFPKLANFLRARAEMAEGKRPLDWAAAEALAFATLLVEGHPIRLSGQDSQRGTFSQRHAVLHDINNGSFFTPLANLEPDQAEIEIINSPLSEAGVLGFDYGYSLDRPETLVAWEAQFGDFWNAAQVIVDQFIASAEDKWKRLSRLTLLLPHGFEGQGPEHCSARLERFLLLTAEDNVQVCQPTTPGQYYHLLRRQVHNRWSKPLIVMTPKSLLRYPKCVSTLEEIAGGEFQRILPDDKVDAANVKRVLLCSGKIYYELLEERERLGREDVALVRVEQFYPLPTDYVMSILADYADGTDLIWVQEEPVNMGGWYFMKMRFGDALATRFPFRLISRVESASPSTGSASAHKLEQRELLDQAFA